MVANSSSDTPAKRPVPVGSLIRSTRFRLWKEQHVPLLYDWLSSRPLSWPSAAVQWGAPIDDGRRDGPLNSFSNRAIYLAERTGVPRSDPNTLLQFETRVVREFTNKPSDVARPWSEQAAFTGHSDSNPPQIRDFVLRKRIIHPGEVNRIRLVAPNVVVTHTDSKNLFLWDFKAQNDRKEGELNPNTPDCTLVGHTSVSDYAIDVAPAQGQASEKWIASGGSDCMVLVWRISDYQSTGKTSSPFVKMTGSRGMDKPAGHSGHVEDVSFCGSDTNLLSSVGRDAALCLWDVRAPQLPTAFVHKAHDGDINCCDFSGIRDNYIATGGMDKMIRIWDRRQLKGPSGDAKPLRVLLGHTNEITNIMWNKNVADVLASGGEDGQVLVWVADEEHSNRSAAAKYYNASPELIFRHIGHGISDAKISDLEWLPCSSDPWCMASLSETVGSGGSLLQIWRMSDMVYKPKEELAADLKQFARGKVL